MHFQLLAWWRVGSSRDPRKIEVRKCIDARLYCTALINTRYSTCSLCLHRKCESVASHTRIESSSISSNILIYFSGKKANQIFYKTPYFTQLGSKKSIQRAVFCSINGRAIWHRRDDRGKSPHVSAHFRDYSSSSHESANVYGEVR